MPRLAAEGKDLAERGAGCLDRWPAWMLRLSFVVVGRDRVAPVDDRAGLIEFIEAFCMIASPSCRASVGCRSSDMSGPDRRQ